jgi:formyl-CoA transferase
VSLSDRPGTDSLFFLFFNANKRSLTLDLKQSQGKEAFCKLVQTADVVLENFGPGTMERLGFGYDTLKQLNPSIVYASIKGFGSYGPYSAFKSFEPVAQAMGGSMSVTGFPDNPPTVTWSCVGDSGTGMHCVVGILAALMQRNTSGEGQQVEVSMQDAVVNLVRVSLRDHQRTGKPVERNGNQLGSFVPANTYRCHPGGANDYVFIIAQQQMWEPLLRAIERADLIGDARYQTAEARVEYADEVNAFIEEWTVRRPKHEVMKILAEAGVPCGACQDTGEVLNDPHLRAREMILDLDHPTRGSYTMAGNPIKLSASNVPIKASPLLGEHSAEILTELGYSEDAIAAMREAGLI